MYQQVFARPLLAFDFARNTIPPHFGGSGTGAQWEDFRDHFHHREITAVWGG